MKNIIACTMVSLLALAGCGVRSNLAEAPKSFLPNSKYVIPFSVTDGSLVDPEVRATTMLIYPNPEDMKDFEMDAMTTSTANEWELTLAELPYRDRLQTKFTKDQDSFQKAMALAKLVFASGQMRDEALRVAYQMEITETAKREQLIVDEQNAGISGASFGSYPCWYDKNDYTLEDDTYRCKLAKTGVFNRKKSASDCESFAKFTFLDTVDENGEKLSSSCKQMTKELLAAVKTKKSKKRARTAGESVVLDLLLEVEKDTQNIFAATMSSKEKPDSSGGPTSVLKFNKLQTEVEDIRLYIEFLGGFSEMKGRQEFSYCNDDANPCNGKISKPEIYTSSRGTKKLRFVITMPDLVVRVNGDVSYEAGAMGLRLVDSEAYYTYTNSGKTRRGVFKLELDTTK